MARESFQKLYLMLPYQSGCPLCSDSNAAQDVMAWFSGIAANDDLFTCFAREHKQAPLRVEKNSARRPHGKSTCHALSAARRRKRDVMSVYDAFVPSTAASRPIITTKKPV